MIILLLFAFLAGVVTILSPCILPILPVVLSGSLTGGKRRPFGIVTGFVASFTFFTLALSTIVKATGIPADSLRTVAVVVIGAFGISLLLPQTQAFLEKLFSKLAGLAGNASNSNRSDFIGGVFVGVSLGLLWAPCVGPILASVITLAITSSVSLAAVFITLAYSIGTAIPMLAITIGGRQLLSRVPWLLANTAKIQKAFGVLMIATAVAIFFSVDRKFQAIVLTVFPQYGAGLTAIEDNALVKTQLEKLTGTKTVSSTQQNKTNTLPRLGIAPELTGGTNWINSNPLTLREDLKGKVVIVDFWTYSCINCIRTLPYLKDWYQKYKDKGLVIVGVHSPEFEFEKNTANVEKAVRDDGIEYPVVQDNDFLIWRAYKNRYWPAKYVIDKNGEIRYTHFGEGKYQETENVIRILLDEEPMKITEKEEGPRLVFGERQTPETYLGFGRADSYTQTMNEIVQNIPTPYSYSGILGKDEIGLSGKFVVEEERIVSEEDTAKLTLNFYAGKVFLVLGGKNKDNIPVTVKLDGKDVDSSVVTKDYNLSGGISVSFDRKYDIIDLQGKPGRHTVELTIPAGISAYAFTFGE